MLKPSDLRDDMPMADWQRLRALLAHGGIPAPPLAGGLSDDLPPDRWQQLRTRQVDGRSLAFDPGAPRQMAAIGAAQPSTKRGPLTGRPGTAALIADALNTVASGPNTSAPINTGGVQGRVTRGSGRDVRAEGTVKGIPVPVGAEGTLDPPTGRAEISASGIRGKGVGLPSRVRIYTTPTGELDVDLSGPIKFGPFTIRPKGTYVLGEPDPPKRR